MKAIVAAWFVTAALAPAASAGESNQKDAAPTPPACQADVQTATARTHEGKGFVFGLGIGPGQIGFADADRLALFVGAGTTREGSCFSGTCISTEVRSGRIAPRGSTLPGTHRVVPFPASQGGLGMSFVFGWSFSPRFAALFDGELAGGLKNERFDNMVGGLVVRYSPASRFWVEAGPAFSQLEYRYDINTFEQGITDKAARVEGGGFLAAAGYEIVRRPSWRFDAQARLGMVWYEQLRTTSLSIQLGIHRRRT